MKIIPTSSFIHRLQKARFLLLFTLIATSAQAEEQQQAKTDTNNTLLVATRNAPPFSIKTEKGWQGISIELVRQATDNAKINFVEMSIDEMLDATANGKVDMAAAALTITAERESKVDFTHPFLSSGIGIAVTKQKNVNILDAVKRFLSPAFLKAVGTLLLVLSIIGILVWIMERRHNIEFPEKPMEGIGVGLWWSAVTMTTVGYGDKSPKTFGGRIIALIWMFASIIIISGFTAAIATSLTVNQLGQEIKNLEDLYDKKVVTIKQSTSENLLKEKLINHSTVADIQEALRLLENGEVSAVVYDMPILQYLVGNEFSQSLRVLSTILVSQDYGIALSTGNSSREHINQEILRIIREPEWNNMLDVYLGRAE